MQVETTAGWVVALMALFAGCIDGGSAPAGPGCRDDDDCAKFSNACNLSACRNDACESEPVICNDSNSCTADRCDVATGCIAAPVEVGTACVVGASDACVANTWNAADACDAEGHCVDGAVTDCEVGVPAVCHRKSCVPEAGCREVAEPGGVGCVENGQSDACVDNVRYRVDYCSAGVCTEAGSEQCPAAFCEVAICEGRDCGARPMGVDVDLAGAWNAFTLTARDGLSATRTNIELAADGSISIQGHVGPADAEAPTAGRYCVSADRKMRFAFDYDGRIETYAGHVSGGRDIGFFTLDDGDGTMVLVRNRDQSEARLIGGTYRIVGIDDLASGEASSVDAMLGTIEIRTNCITSLRYAHGSEPVESAINASDTPACVQFDQLNSISFDVRVGGDVRVWAGVVGTAGRYAVMQRYRAGERLVEPSLVMLVRTGLTTPDMLRGDYALSRITLSADADARVVTGGMMLDGLGAMTDYVEGDFALGPGDVGQMLLSLAEPRSSMLSSVTTSAGFERRLGQSGQASTDRVDWFVDVPATAGASHSGPISGRSLRFGVRQN